MTTWDKELAQFSAVIRSGAEFAPGTVSCPRYAETCGIEVYRNNYRGNLHDTLVSAYPVIRQLVGEEFFRFMAKRFIAQHASRSGNLHRYGVELAEFLTGFEPTRHLAYLPDMARLEWAYHQAYFAADIPPLDINRLSMVPEESYPELRWRLHPSCALLTSVYPIAAIWRAHQAALPADFQIDLQSGGDCVLVYRDVLQMEIINIAPAGQHWLAKLQLGSRMGAATDATLAAYPDFDLGSVLRDWIAQGVLIDFDYPKEEQL